MEDSLVEGVEQTPSEPDINEQSQQNQPTEPDQTNYIVLQQKVSSQANLVLSKLQNLEARIQEFDPSHPLPIKQEHLGKEVSTQDQQYINQLEKQVTALQNALDIREQDLHDALKRIERIEFDFKDKVEQQKNHGISKGRNDSKQLSQFPHPSTINIFDKANLEQSLRSGTITIEEQRTYIEILKQALEAKIKQIGLATFIQQYQNEAVDIFVELQNIKQEVDNNKLQNNQNQRKMLDQEEKIHNFSQQITKLKHEKEDLFQGRESMNEDLNKGIQALALATQQVEKLEEDKAGLLQFVDQAFEKEKLLQNDIKQLKQLNQKLRIDREGIYKQQANLIQEKNFQEQEANNYKTSLLENKQQLSGIRTLLKIIRIY